MVRTSVFFDFGGTLARMPSSFDQPWKVWVEVSRGFNLQLSDTQVQRALEAVGRELEGRIYQYIGQTGEFWRLYDGLVMDRLGLRDRRQELTEAIEKTFGDPSNVQLYPETRAVLEDLRSRGYRLGLISNYTDELLKILQYHELDRLLDSVTYSQEVGAEKPAAEVFAKALQRARCAPSDALHVGDSIRADVEGARRSGLQAIWLNREPEARSVDYPTIHTLDELLPVLERINQREEPRS
jgi:HAD superfamily hydrolase (TIGR01549 family)